MLKPINGRVIVELKKRDKDVIKVGGSDFIVDTAFRQYHNAVQVANVVATDHRIDVEPGDRVYVHHFVQSQENKLPFEGTYSWLEAHHIFCRVRDGEIKPLNRYLFVEPIPYKDIQELMKTESGILLTKKFETEYVERIGIIRLLSDSAKDEGLSEGDRVLFGKNCEYDIEVEGVMYFRMETQDVICVLDDEVKLTRVI